MVRRIWRRAKEIGTYPVQVGWAAAAFLVFALSTTFNYAQLARVQEQSHRDVRSMVENTYQACLVVVRTRVENINQWNDLFDTLDEVTQDPDSDALWDELRARMLVNLPEIRVEECLLPDDVPEGYPDD